ncbi:hypothetical protein ACG2LH_15495 [Zhouia sp. PK063]|uniref:hypothetical protein n=1 Tax=Zhouia sp. PK063 TaxID=3373602 RepID=UPI0037934166
MMKKIVVLLMMLPWLGMAQTFKLKMPDIEKLHKAMQDNSSEDEVYLYLATTYKPAGEKQQVKHYDFDATLICAFEQDFMPNIHYKINNCSEEGAIMKEVIFPTTNKTMVMHWIEQINKCSLTETENSWNTDKTVYSPKDDGAGCYYTIKQTATTIIVEISCGC